MVGALGRSLEPLLRHVPPFPGLGRIMEGLGRVWLRPSEFSEIVLAEATSRWRKDAWPVLNVMFHSSELMPGGSPYVQDRQGLKKFLGRLAAIFSAALSGGDCKAVTLDDARRRLGETT